MPTIATLARTPFRQDALHAVLDTACQPVASDALMRRLVETGCDRLPLPGSGNTLARWRALAAVAAADLSLAKRFEGHTDALAILAELGAAQPPPGSRWGVWCAEPPQQRLAITPVASGQVELNGIKAWCSGAAGSTHAVVSGWTPAGAPWLAAVALAQPGVKILPDDAWLAPAMRDAATVSVSFQGVLATPLGAPGQYVDRPGFLHGGAGVAACWYGGLTRIAGRLRAGASHADPFRLAHLGAVDVALCQARWALLAAAAAIDAAPQDSCALETARARLAVEAAAQDILVRTARALGAGPLCKDATIAQAMADLPLYIRQSHAERDQAAHGAAVARAEEPAWML